MKKFSKESMQNFMLMHAEKLILGGCLAATGVFVWMSMGGENEVKDTPSGLLSKAKTAETYINRDAWEGDDKLQAFRKGETAAKKKIVEATRVDPNKYSLTILGTPALASAKRLDPIIYGPQQPIATRFTVGVMMDLPGYESPLISMNPAPVLAGDEAGGFKRGGGGGDDYGGGYEDGGYEDGGDFGGTSSTGSTGLPESYPVLQRSGIFNDVNAHTHKGLRPTAWSISPDKITTSILDVVCVTAVVDFQKQATAFEKAFADSIAYNAKRDRPVYQFLQVQRREVSPEKTEWKDISEDVMHTYPQRCPNSLSKMPFQLYRSAPEVIAPENYDPIISGVIPAFAMFDYQQIASHPALKRREFPAWIPPKRKKTVPFPEDEAGEGIFGEDTDPEDDDMKNSGPGEDGGVNSLRRGSATDPYKEAIVMRKAGGQYRLVRFFDLRASQKKSYEYRTRVWVGDPNQLDPSDGFKKNRGMRLEFDQTAGVKFAGTTGDGMSSGMDEMDMLDQGDGMSEDPMLDSKRPEKVQDITPSMVAPAVRKRQGLATDLKVMQEQLEAAAVSDKPMGPFHVFELSEAGEFEKIHLPPSKRKYAYMQYLRFARPSPWSEPVRVEKQIRSADVFAGSSIRSRSVSMNAGAGEVQFDLTEPKVEVVVSAWVQDLGTKLPSKRAVYTGETLNFNAPAYLTHPISWEIKAGENTKFKDADDDVRKYILPIRSRAVVVDIFAGEKMVLPTNSKLEMVTPTEVLVMDANGQLKVSNQFDAETDFRNEIAEKDSSRFYGRVRRQKKAKDEYDDGYGDDY